MSSAELKQAWNEELGRRRQALADFERDHIEILAEHARLRARTMSSRPGNVVTCTYCGEWAGQPDKATLPAGWAWKASSCCNEDELCCPGCAAKAPWNYCGNCVRM